MLSNDENIERISDFAEEAKQWFLLRKEYAKLDLIEKVVRILTALTIAFVIALLSLLSLIYLSFAAAYALATQCGSLHTSFLVVSVVYLAILFIVVIKRHSWIERPLVRFLISVFQDNSNTSNEL